MSRGGFKGRKQLPGAEFSWQSEGGREDDTGPTLLFPKYLVPTARELSQTERDQVNHYRRLREEIHDGPYYTVLSGPRPSGKQDQSARARFDPFQGMPSYGQRYVKKTRTLPKLNARPYMLEFFPKELWSTLDTKYIGTRDGQPNGFGPTVSRKRGFEDLEDDELDEDRKRRNAGDEQDGSDADRGNEDILDEDEDEEGEEEVVDDDFEDDEEDMGGDYNAEQYFDAGDDEMDGDGGGGDGDFDTF